jgi:hypothetical protein
MDPELLKYAGQLGVGGVIALSVILLWRKDVKELFDKNREDRERSEKRITDLGSDFKDVIEKGTEVQSRLCVLLETQNRQNGARRGE